MRNNDAIYVEFLLPSQLFFIPRAKSIKLRVRSLSPLSKLCTYFTNNQKPTKMQIQLPKQPQHRRSSSNLQRFSYIFQQQSPTHNPSFSTTKGNLLVILLCISVYFLFYLAQDFVNIILLGFLIGVAYVKLRQRFVNFWKRSSKKYKRVDSQTVSICALMLVGCLLLPWLSYLAQAEPDELRFALRDIVDKLYGRSNIWVRITQIFLFIAIIYNICGNFIDDKLFVHEITPRKQKILDFLLAISVIFMALVICILFLTTIAIELRNAGIFIKDKFEYAYGCRFVVDQPWISQQEKAEIVYCQDKIPQNLKQLVPNIEYDRLKNCLATVSGLQLKYLGYDMFLFEENICTGVNILEQINPNFLQNINTRETTGYAFTLLSSVFGILVNLIVMVTNGVFQLTTFASIFLVTLTNYDQTTSHFHIFGPRKQQLVSQIAVIIEATVFIALEHLIFTIAFLQIIDFSEINTLLSIMLSMIAFIPYVKPSFIMAIMSLLKMFLSRRYIVNIICLVGYWTVSQYIYNRNYSGVGLHKVIINLSVIFGIYQFGVAGILYGPIIIVLFQSVYDEIFK